MYALLWRTLPGPTWAKLGQLLLLATLVFLFLMYVAFPALEPHLPMDRVVVG